MNETRLFEKHGMQNVKSTAKFSRSPGCLATVYLAHDPSTSATVMDGDDRFVIAFTVPKYIRLNIL